MKKNIGNAMTVKEIVEKYLREHRYDGLFCNECGCSVDDLFPCCLPTDDCMAGHKYPCPGVEDCILYGECKFHIGEKKHVGGKGV